MCLTKSQIEKLINDALLCVKDNDSYLLHKNVSERAVSHKLAMYMEQGLALLPEADGLDIDVEYNRNGDIPKKLIDLPPRKATDERKEETSVFPDIVIHKRGPLGPNILVLELKKVGARKDEIEYDRVKLLAYHEDFGYSFAAHLFIKCGSPQTSPKQNPQADGKSEGPFFVIPQV